MKMKFLNLITAAAAVLFAGSALAAGGDIYDIHACRGPEDLYQSYRKAELPLYGLEEGQAMGAGQKAYFKLRLLTRVDGDGEYHQDRTWDFVYIGGGSDAVAYRPQIGVYVSGALRFATYIGRLTDQSLIGKQYVTDLVFEYDTKPGDFALPIVLAAKGSDGKPYPANDTNASISSYYMNPLSAADWELRCPTSDSYVTANLWPASGTLPPVGGDERVTDWTLVKSGFYVRTVDFDAVWTVAGKVWRSVHEGDTSVSNALPVCITAKSPADEEISLYVWSTNESAVVATTGKDTDPNWGVNGVAEVSMVDPQDVAGAPKTYHVVKVRMAAGQQSASFGIFGAAGGEGKASHLILSPYPSFQKNDDYADIRQDFVAVPVTCCEPLPPSVIIEGSDSSPVASYDYKQAAEILTVKLTQPVSKAFKVRITPKLSDGTDISDPAEWGKYVRFSTTAASVATLPEATLPEVTVGPGREDVGIVYVFCLRGDIHTTGVNELQFVPSSDDAPAGEISNWAAFGANVTAQTPEIYDPGEGETLEDRFYQSVPKAIDIRVRGSYADSLVTTGYTVRVRYSGGDWRTLDGTYYPGDGDVLYRTGTANERPALKFPGTGERMLAEIEVIAPTSGKTSAPEAVYRKIYANVRPQKTARLDVLDKSGNRFDTIDENAQVTFKIALSEGYEDGDIFAFLKPSDGITFADGQILAAGTPSIVGVTNQTGKCTGTRISQNTTNATIRAVLADGLNPWDGGLYLQFDVVLATVQDWTTATNQNKIIEGLYISESDPFSVDNVNPTVRLVTMDGLESAKESGYVFKNKVARGQKKSFVATVVEPSSYDLAHDFTCQWTAYLNDVPVTNAVLKGAPADTPFEYDFPRSGDWTVELRVKDKDMDDGDEEESLFTFGLTVLDSPMVEVNKELGDDHIFLETETRGTVDIGLSFFPPKAEKLEVEVSVEKIRADKTGDYGEVVLETNRLVFTSALTQKIGIESLDGTDLSSIYGWRVRARVVSTEENPDTHEPWSDYFIEGSNRIYVENVAPNGGDADSTFTPDENGTNAWDVAGGLATDHPLTFIIKRDVDRDFTYNPATSKWTTNGIRVTITGGGGESYNQDGFVNGVKYFAEADRGTYIPNFGNSQGEQSVTITVEDKDGGTLSHTWKFNVAASKFLTTVATRPSGGITSSKLSQKYMNQSGIGMGHVFAYGTIFSSAENFSLKWNCGKQQTAPLYGWGYKVGAVDNGSLDLYDQPIDGLGRECEATSASAFKYADHETVLDSFLYGWLMYPVDEKGSSSGSGTSISIGSGGNADSEPTMTIAPEHAKGAPGNAKATLASTLNTDKSYAECIAEAIFSKEIMESDNCGDINWDWIPDVFYVKYDFDSEGGEETQQGGGNPFGGGGEDDEAAKDLVKITNYNEDGDYLPAYVDTPFDTFAKGLTNMFVFTARMEIRGVDDHLNDATASRLPNNDGTWTVNPGAVDGVKPEKRYLDPNVDATSTLSPVEWLAWLDFAASKGPGFDATLPANWDLWSPERPTSPVEDDTDGDGFPDGFEYFFWYRAHVGYIDANGQHRYLTGRRYDPRNPGEGTLITKEEIERTFDPISGNSSNAQLTDTDNDGVPDLLEVLLGTNPFDFDTDRDGLPDGWEIMFAGTDPVNAYTTEGICDAMRNFDGDAMAFTTPGLEADVLPRPLHTDDVYSFALVERNGDSDGVQWYVTKTEPLLKPSPDAMKGWVVTWKGTEYVTTVEPFFTTVGGQTVLAVDLPKAKTRSIARGVEFPALPEEPVEPPADGADGEDEEEEEPETETYDICLAPTFIPAGTVLDAAPTLGEENQETFAAATLAEGGEYSTAWIYGAKAVDRTTTGQALANNGSFGHLAIGRYKAASDFDPLAELPKPDPNVAYIHSLVYQEFGFDPRTAWNANTPLAARWGATDGEGVKDNNYNKNKGGYAGVSTRTREYTAYDEFLVYSFFINNGVPVDHIFKLGDRAPSLAQLWAANTTNPQGPEEEIDTSTSESTESIDVRFYGTDDSNGADTDGDGVPDGWELYVMAGPKGNEDKFVFAAPYGDGYLSSFGPFVADAGKSSMTDNGATGGNSTIGGDNDGLTELGEFAGTDSCNYYSKPWNGRKVAYSTTITRPEEQAKWLNKFFPTDPWNPDTDGDTILDGRWNTDVHWNFQSKGTTGWFFNSRFVYGNPVDDGSICIPGGGLNPCSVDTDGDGLPDPWESQFAGTTIFTGPGAVLTKDKETGVEGNPTQGLIDGMDGTVKDAFSSPVSYISKTFEDGTVSNVLRTTALDGVIQNVNRDYDHDGLENWQEYMTGLMRCWRYDDPLTRWDYLPEDLYFETSEDGARTFTALDHLDRFVRKDGSAIETADEFWYETLVNVGGEFYNPHFLTDMSPANYMTRVTNGWDPRYTEDGTYYWLYDRIGGVLIEDLWGEILPLADGMSPTPFKYACCSPIEADSDGDGMDDYYELFHGLNPLLGESGKVATSGAVDTLIEKKGPCDLVYDAWYVEGSEALEAWAASDKDRRANFWQRSEERKALSRSLVDGGYDFAVYPWLNGLQNADPDGDDLRNYNESIQARLATATWHHTDPTPLWMTDSSYSNSLTRLFFRMPRGVSKIDLTGIDQAFTYTTEDGDVTRELREFDGFAIDWLSMDQTPYFAAYSHDKWELSAAGEANWMYSFEENEGYDSDHDGISDYEEAQGTVRSATDPQDADSPRRRQAMYFPGADAALQTPPLEIENHPCDLYPDDIEFQTYTVECWVLPERDTDQVIVERAIWTQYANPGDEEFLRKNFQLAIRGKKWYTKYDPNGTAANNPVEVYSSGNVTVGAWTHLAATYDGAQLILYVNGAQQTPCDNTLMPECGMSVLALRTDNTGLNRIGDYWFGRKYAYHAIVVGASVKGRLELPEEARATGYLSLDLSNGMGWGGYKSFFQGYVDEVRIWDGARDADAITDDYIGRARYDSTRATELRSDFYGEWNTGKRRYVRGTKMSAELRYHWSFDSVFGAENATQVAKWPHAFGADGRAYLSRPVGYVIDWWKKAVAGDGERAGYGSVYAGNYDWITWIPNTVAHLPRYDGTTLDSVLWSDAFCGDLAGTYVYPTTAEPYSRWTQMTYNGVGSTLGYKSTGSRHRFINQLSYDKGSNSLVNQFEFTGRHTCQAGADLLPLGGAFVKYVPGDPGMWDDQGASSLWEQTGSDSDNAGLPDWWREYADQNYRGEGEDTSDDPILWNTLIEYGGRKMTAGEAYLRDLAKGMYVSADGSVNVGPTVYAQTAKSDGLIPDWWKSLRKIDNEAPLADTDRDGLNNYAEYVASEVLPLGLSLNPKQAKSDTKTLDYFLPVGKLYLGEVLTDHDMMEDHWETALGRDANNQPHSSTTAWDALRDRDGDGWTSFEENRYNGYTMSTLAQLASHAVGYAEVLDAPIPTIKLTVRYNGSAFGTATVGKDATEGRSDISIANTAIPRLYVRTYTRENPATMDAQFSIKPGEKVSKAVYLGGWEDRIVRGTMGPGNIDIGSVNIKFAQIPQGDLFSWYDESGLHLARPYKEFKAALAKNPEILQNLQSFPTGADDWLELTKPTNPLGVTADRAVTVTSDGKILVYGGQVGTVDLITGDYEFDMTAMNNNIRPQLDGVAYTFGGERKEGWSYQEAIFKLTYEATVPSVQAERFQVSLAAADAGYVRSGLNTIMAFFDTDGNGDYTPGEPMGVLNDVEIGWAGRAVELELTDMSAVTPRLRLWSATTGNAGGNSGSGNNGSVAADPTASDRGVHVGVGEFTDGSNRYEVVNSAPASKVRVRVVRYMVDGIPVYEMNVPPRAVMESDFEQTARNFLYEGDFLTGDAPDIDWANFYDDVVANRLVAAYQCDVTNVSYIVTYNWTPDHYVSEFDTNTPVKANSTLVTRRFERDRSVPTPCMESMICSKANPTFAWKIENEDVWASWFGTTYTAFKVRVRDANGGLVYDSGVRRLPAKDINGVYTWTAPLYVNSASPSHPKVIFANDANYTWEVAVYNAKFSTDTLMARGRTGNPFSDRQTFRMHVSTLDTSSYALTAGVRYAGPAQKLSGRIRVQAFTTPDFTGEPAAEMTLGDVTTLSPSNTSANVKLIGLQEGSYFVRAYIDTNTNGVRDDWESWGYLCERDYATKIGIFNPVSVKTSFNPSERDVRQLYIEDCDIDGDMFPDVWEAEKNGDAFVARLTKDGQGPVRSSNSPWLGYNPDLVADVLVSFPTVDALMSADGVAVAAGVPPEKVTPNPDGGFSLASEVDPETLTIVGIAVDAAQSRVLLKVGAETTANVDAAVANFLNVTVRKGAEVTVRVECAESPNGPWTVAKDADGKEIGGTVTVDRTGADIVVQLDGKLPAQGYFRAKVEE